MRILVSRLQESHVCVTSSLWVARLRPHNFSRCMGTKLSRVCCESIKLVRAVEVPSSHRTGRCRTDWQIRARGNQTPEELRSPCSAALRGSIIFLKHVGLGIWSRFGGSVVIACAMRVLIVIHKPVVLILCLDLCQPRRLRCYKSQWRRVFVVLRVVHYGHHDHRHFLASWNLSRRFTPMQITDALVARLCSVGALTGKPNPVNE